MKEFFLIYKHVLVILLLISLLMGLHYYSPIHLTWFAPLFFERLSSRNKFVGNIKEFEDLGYKPNFWTSS